MAPPLSVACVHGGQAGSGRFAEEFGGRVRSRRSSASRCPYGVYGAGPGAGGAPGSGSGSGQGSGSGRTVRVSSAMRANCRAGGALAATAAGALAGRRSPLPAARAASSVPSRDGAQSGQGARKRRPFTVRRSGRAWPTRRARPGAHGTSVRAPACAGAPCGRSGLTRWCEKAASIHSCE
ncbi:hypothetical protein GCM10010286_03170 [Streptomyces toxytricini]|nr:hypothetical protein GCM10010286_03170 [Streptomyces toxytricini]